MVGLTIATEYVVVWMSNKPQLQLDAVWENQSVQNGGLGLPRFDRASRK